MDNARATNPTDSMIMTQVWRVHNELSTDEQGLVWQEKRIVMPKQLWGRAVNLAHQGHQGAAEMKTRLKTNVWVPGMNTIVEEKVKQCHLCLAKSGDPELAHITMNEP